MKPPSLAGRLLTRLVMKSVDPDMMHDLEERFAQLLTENGAFRARLWYWIQTVKVLLGKWFNHLYWSLPMILNYLKVAWRNIRRNKAYAILNIAGLSIGLAASLIILLFVTNELSFDRFHENADRIYRVGAQHGPSTDQRGAFTPPRLATALKNDFPEIEAITRLNLWKRTWVIRHGDQQFLEKNIIHADSTVFDVFTFEWIAGDARTALTKPDHAVITDRIATKYFRNQEALGNVLRLSDRDIMISGVVKALPKNSHFQFDIMRSIVSTSSHDDESWMGHSHFTYVLLREDTTPEALQAKFPAFFLKHYGPTFFQHTGIDLREHLKDENNYYGYYLQPLLDIHLNGDIYYLTETAGERRNVILFSTIAFSILIVACINFVNLSTARSEKRAREVGIRKVVGTSRGRLFHQFFSESIFLCVLSFLLALVIVHLILPMFNTYLNRDLSVHLQQNPLLVLGFLGFAVLVGVGAGVYPATVLSAFRPVDVLKRKFSRSPSGSKFRSGLVVFQFIVSIGLIAGALVIGQQLQYVRKASLGFDQERIIVIDRFRSLDEQRQSFVQSLKQHPDIRVVSNTYSVPGRHFEPSGYTLDGKPTTDDYFFWTMWADHAYKDLLGLEVVQGTFFSETPPEGEIALVINEEAIRKNRLVNPLGQTLTMSGTRARIIGVVKDFHFQSLHRPIESMMIAQVTGLRLNTLCVKVGPGDIHSVIAFIQEQWRAFTEGSPFQFELLDEDFNSLYVDDVKTGQLILLFSCMTIIIACLGIFGLAASSVERRTKEVGIRKVAGATEGRIMTLLMADFVRWILVAFIVASPLAYWAMGKWLQNFAYRTGISWWIFVAAGLGTLVIALLTVSWQTIRAARSNPVDALRYE